MKTGCAISFLFANVLLLALGASNSSHAAAGEAPESELASLPSAQPYITNFVCSSASGGKMSVGFTVGGGVSSKPYDVFRVTSLPAANAHNESVVWVRRCFSGDRCELFEEPADSAFYVLREPSTTDSDAAAIGPEAASSKSPSPAYKGVNRPGLPLPNASPTAQTKGRFRQPPEGFKVTLSSPR